MVLRKSVTVTGYTIAGTDAGNYTLAQPTGLSANITEASAGLAWSAPSAITYGTLLSATQLNATASVPGTQLAMLKGMPVFKFKDVAAVKASPKLKRAFNDWRFDAATQDY